MPEPNIMLCVNEISIKIFLIKKKNTLLLYRFTKTHDCRHTLAGPALEAHLGLVCGGGSFHSTYFFHHLNSEICEYFLKGY